MNALGGWAAERQVVRGVSATATRRRRVGVGVGPSLCDRLTMVLFVMRHEPVGLAHFVAQRPCPFG